MATIIIDKNKIKKNFIKYNSIATIYYPLKSNSNKAILKELKNIFEDKNKFLISSKKHFNILKKENIENDKICVINPLISNKEVEFLYNNKIRYFTFDNLSKIVAFEKYASKKDVNLNIRLSINEIFNTDTYLGCSLIECKNILNHVQDKYKTITISFYLPKNVKEQLNAIEKMLLFIADNLNGYKINYINIGGITNKNINSQIINHYKDVLSIKDIIIEPGYELLKDVYLLKSKIISHKVSNNTQIMIIENGIYSGLLDVILYEKKFPMYFKVKNKIIFLSNEYIENSSEILIYGSSSDSKDFLGKYYLNNNDIKLLNITKYIYIKDVSTYFEEFIMEYGTNIKINYKIGENNEI